MDFPASAQALWGIFDATGIRPEWLLPGLDIESGLNPSLPNEQGYPYYGINQVSGGFLQAMGIDPQDYLTWPASAQLDKVVRAYMANEVRQFGPLLSGVRVYQANFYPASLRTATGPNDPIVCKPNRPCQPHDGNAYCANIVLDFNRDGCITPSDLAVLVGQHARTSRVQNALTQTYTLRSWETMTDPVWGKTMPWWRRMTTGDWMLAGAATAVLVGGTVAAAHARRA